MDEPWVHRIAEAARKKYLAGIMCTICIQSNHTEVTKPRGWQTNFIFLVKRKSARNFTYIKCWGMQYEILFTDFIMSLNSVKKTR